VGGPLIRDGVAEADIVPLHLDPNGETIKTRAAIAGGLDDGVGRVEAQNIRKSVQPIESAKDRAKGSV
jgi:hypothetical protein